MTRPRDTASQRSGNTDDGLLAQHKLLVAVIGTKWATRLDHKVAAVIIERYMRRQQNARVSLRYLQVATGSQRNKIIASIRRLCLNGVFNVIREGLGTRPTEYALNFAFASSGTAEGTSSDETSSGSLEGTSCGTLEGTARDPRGTLEGTESSLTVTGLQAELQEREIDCAAPTAPPGSGLDGRPGADAAQGEFEEVYRAYGYKRNRADARREYEAIDPNDDLHRQIVEAANIWREAWEAQNKPDAPRKHLASWLKSECYFEDPPTAYKAKERKPKAERHPKPETRDAEPATRTGTWTDVLTIVDVETVGNPFGEFGVLFEMGDPEGGYKKHHLRIYNARGEMGDDIEVFNAIQTYFGDDRDLWPGAKLRLELDGEQIVGMTPVMKSPKSIRKTVTGTVVGAHVRDNYRGGQYLDLEIELPDGEFVGTVEASLSPDRLHEFHALAACAGLVDPQEDSEFIGRTMTVVVDGNGEFVEALPAATVEPAASPQETERPPFDEVGFRERIRRLEGPSFGGEDWNEDD